MCVFRICEEYCMKGDPAKFGYSEYSMAIWYYQMLKTNKRKYNINWSCLVAQMIPSLLLNHCTCRVTDKSSWES